MKAESSILKVLAYFDLFRYPITSDEIRYFLDQRIENEKLTAVLTKLLKEEQVYQLEEFYSLQNDPFLAKRRKEGNERAASLLGIAQKVAKVLYKFPYVRAVAVSGSVSKNFADENADIDYFIITKANRLWIARTLLHLFKKNPFLKNRDTHYCMNYFVDEADLVIEEKNIYTATELYTIIPMAGNGGMKRFFEENIWSINYFPNKELPAVTEKINKPDPWFKKLSEFLLNNKLGDILDNYFMGITTRRWKKKEDEHRLNTKGERMGLKTGKHYSKPSTSFFHDHFLLSYQKKLEEIEKRSILISSLKK